MLMFYQKNEEYLRNKEFAIRNIYFLQDKFSKNKNGTLIGILNEEAKPLEELIEKIENNRDLLHQIYITYIPNENNTYLI